RISGTSWKTPGDDRSELQDVVLAHDLVDGQKVAAANHEYGLREHPELGQEFPDPPASSELDLATLVAENDLHPATIHPGLVGLGSPGRRTRPISLPVSAGVVRRPTTTSDGAGRSGPTPARGAGACATPESRRGSGAARWEGTPRVPRPGSTPRCTAPPPPPRRDRIPPRAE